MQICIFVGDIKCENVLITSSNWLYLADFASFKPTYIPYDDPSDFSFFFDTGGRRLCYLAPEVGPFSFYIYLIFFLFAYFILLVQPRSLSATIDLEVGSYIACCVWRLVCNIAVLFFYSFLNNVNFGVKMQMECQ